MQILKIDPKKPELGKIKRAAEVILAGGVVAYPTDTAYGLAVNALDDQAIGKLFIIKHRVQKPLPVVVSSIEMLKEIAEVNETELELTKKHWPGPLTIIFKKKDSVPPFLTLGLPTIGIRIPDHMVAQELVRVCEKPLTSTSANITGQGNCYTPECVVRMFQDKENQPDLILDVGELVERPVSTVVEVRNKKIHVLRQGPINP